MYKMKTGVLLSLSLSSLCAYSPFTDILQIGLTHDSISHGVTAFGKTKNIFELASHTSGVSLPFYSNSFHFHVKNGHFGYTVFPEGKDTTCCTEKNARDACISDILSFEGADIFPLVKLDPKHNLWIYDMMQDINLKNPLTKRLLLTSTLIQMVKHYGEMYYKTIIADNDKNPEAKEYATQSINELIEKINISTVEHILSEFYKSSSVIISEMASKYMYDMYFSLDPNCRREKSVETAAFPFFLGHDTIQNELQKKIRLLKQSRKDSPHRSSLVLEIVRLYHMLGAWLILHREKNLEKIASMQQTFFLFFSMHNQPVNTLNVISFAKRSSQKKFVKQNYSPLKDTVVKPLETFFFGHSNQPASGPDSDTSCETCHK